MIEGMVSVIIATYHRNESLKKALISLGCQSYGLTEVVVVDDNANAEWNQKVDEIIKNFRKEFPNFRIVYIVNEKNLGSAKTRNLGVENSNGEYVTFLDDDDEYLPDKIKNQFGFMMENQLDYSVTDLDLYYDNGKLAEHKTREYIRKKDRKSLMEYHFMHHITGTDTMMFKKDYFIKIGGFAPIDVGDEFYLMQRAIEHEGKFGYLPTCDVRAIIHTVDEGLSSGEGKIKGENQLYEHKKKFFNQMSRKNRRYIKMRHWAVLAFAEKRRGRKFKFIGYGIKAFLIAPIASVKMIMKR